MSVSPEETVLRELHPDVYAPLHERILGADPRIAEVNALIARLAPVPLSVLITGETGTGKDIVARLLHKKSPRMGKPFIKVNCPSIPEGILESELFGYERGAFTGAHTAKPGRFELANEGTIFLDEIAETPPAVQGKLLQVLDDEPFLRIGGTEPVHTNARVVAATNIPLDHAVSSGRMRQDIAFRLSEVVIHLPPLRERRDDIPLLAEHFNYNMCRMLKKKHQPLSRDLIGILQDQEWPGNIRELAARIKKFVATGSPLALRDGGPAVPVSVRGARHMPDESPAGLEDSTMRRASTPALDRPTAGPGRPANGERTFPSLKEAARVAAEAAEKALIEEALRYTLWNRRKAASLLDTSYSSLLRRIDAYRIGKS